MKKLIVNILIFAAVIVVIDCLFGAVCRYMNSHARGGDTLNNYVITQEQTAPVIIMGSSRAVHHYNPAILEDSLGLSVYNCGVDGNGIIFQYGRLKLLLERYAPKVIVYDVCPPFDIAEGDNQRYIKGLKRWKDSQLLDSLLADVDPLESVKLKSNLYRYNVDFLQMAMDNIHPMQNVTYNGFKPMAGVVNYEPRDKNPEPVEWDSIKYKYFNKFLDLCQANGINVVVSYSPSYLIESSREMQRMTELCQQRGIPVIDMYAYAPVSENTTLFSDATHLNEQGADAFSGIFANLLKQQLKTTQK